MKYPEKQLQTADGIVTVRYSKARKRVAFAIKNNTVELLAPCGIPDGILLRILQENAAVLQSLRQRADELQADAYPPPDFRIGGSFRIAGEKRTIVRGTPSGFDGRYFRTACLAPAAIKRDILTACRAFAQKMICAKAAEISHLHGIDYTSVTINAAERRWGSCSASGALHFSWKIVLLPEELADYIIAHELAHRHQMNHSAAFWREVAAICPDWKNRRKSLREEERRLLHWEGIR